MQRLRFLRLEQASLAWRRYRLPWDDIYMESYICQHFPMDISSFLYATSNNSSTILESSPAEIASQAAFMRYSTVALSTAWVYDILNGIPEDVQLFKSSRISLVSAAYVLSRIAILCSLCACFAFTFGLTDDCITTGKAIAWSSTFCFFPNSLLFLIRVRAVYYDCRLVRLLFTLLWFSVVAAAFAQPFCVNFAPVGLSAGCMATAVEPYCSSGLVAAMVHDTLVLFAISTRLIMDSLVDSLTGRLKAFLSGEGMSNLSRLLLQTGQLYYLITAAVNIAAVAIIFHPSVSPILRSTVVVPNLVVYNIMACHIWRQTKLGAISETATTSGSLVLSWSAPLRFAVSFIYSRTEPSSVETRNLR